MLHQVLRVFLVHHWMLAVVRGLCSISMIITLRTILGYWIFGIDEYHWISDVAMALSTAISLFCITISVFFLSLVVDKLLIEHFIKARETNVSTKGA